MRLRCSRCRKAWIESQEGRCAQCSQVLGTREEFPAAAAAAMVLDARDDLNSDFSEPPTEPNVEPPVPWVPEGLTMLTGKTAAQHHGIPERMSGGPLPAGLTPFESYLLSLVDGSTNVDTLVAASGLAVREGAQALQNLKDKGLVRFRDGDAPPQSWPVAGAGAPSSNPFAPPAAGTPPPRTQDAHHHLQLAVSARDRGELGRAREHAHLAWLISPTSARAAQLMEELEDAKHCKQRARLLHDLGNAAHHAGEYAGAAAHYRAALDEFEPTAVIHHKLAMVLVLGGVSLEEAEQHLLRATQLQPRNDVYKANLERVRQMKDQGRARSA